MLSQGAVLRAACFASREKFVEANMQTQPQTQATFTMPHKPHRLIASDRVEGTVVRRSPICTR
jgi:hypothetical protein